MNRPAAERLLRYFEEFRERQSADDFQSGCLVVTLGPEAANFAGPMRDELNSGVSQIIDRLERIISAGVADGSMSSPDPRSSAETLYDIWVGAAWPSGRGLVRGKSGQVGTLSRKPLTRRDRIARHRRTENVGEGLRGDRGQPGLRRLWPPQQSAIQCPRVPAVVVFLSQPAV